MSDNLKKTGTASDKSEEKPTVKEVKKSYRNTALHIFQKFEQIIAGILAIFIGLLILVSILRFAQDFYHLFVLDIRKPENISFEDYQRLFGKIMTILISLEFMSSVLKVLKTHHIKTLILDVVLITALAIARKLIVFDYDHHDALTILAMGALLASIGIFYFLIRFQRKSEDQPLH